MTQMNAGQVPGIPASGQFRIASVNLHGGLRNTGYPGDGADYDHAGLVRVMSDGDRWPHILIMGFSNRRASRDTSDLRLYVTDMSATGTRRPCRSWPRREAVQEESCGCRDGVQPEPGLVYVRSAWMRASGVAHGPQAIEHGPSVVVSESRFLGEALDGVPAVACPLWPGVAGVVCSKMHYQVFEGRPELAVRGFVIVPAEGLDGLLVMVEGIGVASRPEFGFQRTDLWVQRNWSSVGGQDLEVGCRGEAPAVGSGCPPQFVAVCEERLAEFAEPWPCVLGILHSLLDGQPTSMSERRSWLASDSATCQSCRSIDAARGRRGLRRQIGVIADAGADARSVPCPGPARRGRDVL